MDFLDDTLPPLEYPEWDSPHSTAEFDEIEADEGLTPGTLAIRSQRGEELVRELERTFYARGKPARASRRRPRIESEEEQYRRIHGHYRAASSDSNLVPNAGPILQSAAWRSQLRTRFDEGFFPQLVRGGGAFYPYYGFSLLGDGWSPAVVAAGDAMCVLQLGLQFEHRDILLAFHSLYSKALVQMRVELQSARALRSPDDILCAGTLLTICEGMISGSLDSAGWNTHIRGLLDFLAACGPSVLNGTEKRFTDAAWFHNWRMMAHGYGLGARQRLLVEDSAWQQDGAAVDPLTKNMLHVPGWLEDLDNLAIRDAPLSEVEPVFKSAMELGDTMREQIKQSALLPAPGRGATANAGPPFVLVPISTFPKFVSIVGDLSPLVPEAYLFSSSIAAGSHKNYWTCQLLLDQSLLDLRVIFPSLLTDEQVEALEKERDDCIANLCRCIPFFSAPGMGSVGLLVVRGPVHFAKMHYARFGDEQMMQWCQKVSEGVMLSSRVLKVLSGANNRRTSSTSGSEKANANGGLKGKGKSPLSPGMKKGRLSADRSLGGTDMQGGRWKEIPPESSYGAVDGTSRAEDGLVK